MRISDWSSDVCSSDLVAEDGPTLFEAAEKAGRDLYFEAAVAGAIPILRPLRESLAGDKVTRVLGIVNGTTNFILDKMDTQGSGFEEALEEAQARSEERRGGKERVSACGARWSPYH